MITVRKLGSLPKNTRLRKIIRVLKQYQVEAKAGKSINISYLTELLTLLKKTVTDQPHLVEEVDALSSRLHSNGLGYRTRAFEAAELIRRCNNLQASLERMLGEEPADWDLIDEETGKLNAAARRVLPFTVFLEDVRSPFNVGAIFRTADAFAVEHVFLSPSTPLPTHKRAQRAAMGCTDIVPWSVAPLQEVIKETGKKEHSAIFALEQGGTPLGQFSFPDEGTLIIGSEELGVSAEALRAAETGLGRVSIPSGGVKNSLNVSVAFGILMYEWYASGATG